MYSFFFIILLQEVLHQSNVKTKFERTEFLKNRRIESSGNAENFRLGQYKGKPSIYYSGPANQLFMSTHVVVITYYYIDDDGNNNNNNNNIIVYRVYQLSANSS